MTRLLTINAGSTSVKTSLLARENNNWVTVGRYDSLEAGLAASAGVQAVVHRVVHGGQRHRPVVVDDAVLAELRALTELAPLHQPIALDAMEHARRALPTVRHIACFDTAFHTTIPEAAATYALPERLRAVVRVVGFHGLSHAWASARARSVVPDARRVLVAHLGGGASLCAVLDGRSIATTMGFTPLDGLVMATRSGAVDPGALIWLGRTTGEDLESVLERESGLLGLCGSADMNEVLSRAAASDEAALLAREVYLYRLVTSIGAMTAALKGLDVLVFTGGAGEHSAELRDRVARCLGWLGVHIRADEQSLDGDISTQEATVRVLVVNAREDLQMANDASELLSGSATWQ